MAVQLERRSIHFEPVEIRALWCRFVQVLLENQLFTRNQEKMVDKVAVYDCIPGIGAGATGAGAGAACGAAAPCFALIRSAQLSGAAGFAGCVGCGAAAATGAGAGSLI